MRLYLMPKKETPGVVRQDGTRGGGHLKYFFNVCSICERCAL